MLLITRLILASVLYSVVSAQPTRAEEPGFYKICNQYLPLASLFAVDCLGHAREQMRYFNGEPERHSVYFFDKPIFSHFGLGCTLGSTGKIAFLGIYYASHPEFFALANSAKIRFVDFSDNVGLIVNNEPVTLLAIRRIVTEASPPPFANKWDKNCSGEDDPQSVPIHIPHGNFIFDRTTDHNDVIVRACRVSFTGVDPLCESNRYIEFFGNTYSRIIFFDGAYSNLIEENGGLLTKKSSYYDGCHRYYDRRVETLNINQELCQ